MKSEKLSNRKLMISKRNSRFARRKQNKQFQLKSNNS